MINTTMVPFVKWVGGKRQLLKEIEKRLPNKFNTYYEPFIGGGAVFFHLGNLNKINYAVINDLNKELINAYKRIKVNYNTLKEYLLLMEYGHNFRVGDQTSITKYYNQIRQIDRNAKGDGRTLSMSDSPNLRAARFIYLNKAGFNGLYRVNSSGLFNVPSGQKDKVNTHEYPNLENISIFLKENTIKITSKSFDKSLKDAKEGDFVYLDPPYDYEIGMNGFDSYQKESFGKAGQEKLAKVCQELNDKGVKFLLSNHDTKLVNDLYKEFKIDVVRAKRVVGGKGASRNDVNEVLVRNYE